MAKRKTHKEFEDELFKVNPDIVCVGKYEKSTIPIKVKSKKCTHEWEAKPAVLLNGSGCPKCARNQKLSDEEFKNRVNKVLPYIEVVGDYKNSTSRIRAFCTNCGKEWNPIARSLLDGHGCKKCSSEALGKKYTLSHTEFIEKIHRSNPDIQILGKYKSSRETVKCKCTVCGDVWEPKASSLLSGSGCRRCSYNARRLNATMPEEEFLVKMSENKKVTIIGRYSGTKKKIKVRCNYCGYEWDANTKGLLRGNGCSKCAHTSTSYIEQLIYLIFCETVGAENVASRDRKAIGKELDIYIPLYKVAIEYGAWNWHKPILERDIEKYASCKDAGIRLIRIYDYCYGDHTAAGEDVFLFDYPLSDNTDDFLSLMKHILMSIGLEYNVDGAKYVEISTKAYENSRRLTPAEFKKKVDEINKDIEVLGEYLSSSEKIEVKCKLCGRKWEMSPAHLLQGVGCSACKHKENGKKLRTSSEEFAERLSQISGNIQLLESYKKGNSRIKARCKICGHIWNPMAKDLLQGRGCPICRYVKSSTKRLDTTETFKEKLHNVNPYIEVIGDYVRSNVCIKVRCKICGHVWEARPNNLTQGSGCPICRRKQATKNRKKTLEMRKQEKTKCEDIPKTAT